MDRTDPGRAPRSPPRPAWHRWLTVAALTASVAVAAQLTLPRGVDRPEPLPLLEAVDGPGPDAASAAVVYLHGLGRTLRQGEDLARRLRAAGLPSSVAVISLEGPYSARRGQHWGGTAEAQARSRTRIREALRPWLERSPPLPVTLVGFSQGAGVAADLAVEEPRITALAAFAPCFMWLRGELPGRKGLRVLLAHGARDERCPPSESRTLAPVLERAGVPVRYLEFDGGHVVPDEVVAALVALATGR